MPVGSERTRLRRDDILFIQGALSVKAIEVKQISPRQLWTQAHATSLRTASVPPRWASQRKNDDQLEPAGCVATTER